MGRECNLKTKMELSQLEQSVIINDILVSENNFRDRLLK